MDEDISIKTGLPVFNPVSRHVVLFNNYDCFPEYSQATTYLRGNDRIYELEAILRGNFGDGPAELQEFLSAALPAVYGYALFWHQEQRQGITYNSASRILPPAGMRKQLEMALEGISAESSQDTLTFLYITSHGNEGCFQIDNTQTMDYKELLDRLDRIKGKKVIVALACYSGSLIDAWKKRETSEDYIIITSTGNWEPGINWNEGILHNLLVKYLRDKNALSTLKIPAVIFPGTPDEQHPQIVSSFDVVL